MPSRASGFDAPLAAQVVGKPAPDFKLADANGKPVSLADFRGKTVVLEWNNPGCPFVKKHYGSGNMQRTQAAAAQGRSRLADDQFRRARQAGPYERRRSPYWALSR